MGEARLGKFEKIDEKLIFKSRVLGLYTEKLRTPSGKEVEWVQVRTGGAAAVLAIDEDGNIVLVKQYRVTTEAPVLEIPAGGLEIGEDPKDCAVRELLEETGHRAKTVEKMFSAYSTIGFCNEVIHYYLIKCESGYSIDLDPDEYVEVEKYSVDEVVKMIQNGEIVDAKTISSVMYYKGLSYKNI